MGNNAVVVGRFNEGSGRARYLPPRSGEMAVETSRLLWSSWVVGEVGAVE